jgi:hypothetical protein
MFAIKLNASDGRSWIAACLSRSHPSLGAARRSSSSLEPLAGHSADAVLFLDNTLRKAFHASKGSLWRDMPDGKSTFIVLVPRRAAPETDPYFGEPSSSFLCSPDILQRYVALNIDCWPQTILFALLRAIFDGLIHVDRLLVRQIPVREQRMPAGETTPKALLMPHRGDPKHLTTALDFLSRMEGNSLSINVGLDVDHADDYRGFVNERTHVNFFHANPAPVGPYVIRQDLAERSTEPLLCLQDSDDISCHDRLTVLSHALTENGCGIAGSHELCFDEMRAMVYPVWYPIDSSASLKMVHNHALLHATMMARRSAFFECGGLSTHLVIANDTQFMLRAFFTTTIRNADAFLYIRRRHAVSLTNAPETVHDNPLRRALNAEWTADFAAIKRGELKVEDSSLRPMRRTAPYRLERLSPG